MGVAASDARYMARALELAERAGDLGEVPVGAVVVVDQRVVGEGHNAPLTRTDPTAHAEVVALRDAARRTGNYRLADATLYVTLEPCCMCAGAILQARVARVVYGADDPAQGAVQSNFGLLDVPRFNHRCAFTSGVEARASRDLLQAFFAARRA